MFECSKPSSIPNDDDDKPRIQLGKVNDKKIDAKVKIEK